jgi:hypothetical protein
MGVLETKEGREDVKNWFKREFDFTDESASSFERSKRGWNLILALWVVGEAAKPLETGLRNLAKAGSESVTLRGGLVERIYQESALRSQAGAVGKDVAKATVQDVAPKIRALPEKLYYYTDEATAAAIEKSQLGLPGRTTYLTPKGDLKPLQAQIELSLPRQNTATAVFEVSTEGLDRSKVLLKRRVTGNVQGHGGGGTEILYDGPIPLENARRIK